jgi:hypothetical protein
MSLIDGGTFFQIAWTFGFSVGFTVIVSTLYNWWTTPRPPKPPARRAVRAYGPI